MKIDLINYEELNRQTEEILNGNAYIDFLSLEEESGRKKGGKRNVEATLLLRTDDGTNREERKNVADWQVKILKEYALHEGIWIAPNTFKEFINKGDEGKMYNSPKLGYVQKVYDYRRFSNTPLDFLTNRISLHNFIFSDTPYTLVGFTTTEDFMGKQTFAFVLEHPFIQGTYLKPTERIEVLLPEMKKNGYDYRVENFKLVFFNQDYIVRDLNERNILVDNSGKLFFIDTVPELNTPESGFGGNRKYGDGRIIQLKSKD
ncbi:MAG: hypothetical protein GX102_05840 [Porphyromonadaceae bacterium]|nr:hypothetical protein [Porphyromonadaceae bacterium]